MAIPSITNTSPITAEWLNHIVSTVNALQASLENRTKVTVSGLNLTAAATGNATESDVLIVIGEKSIKLPKSKSTTTPVEVVFSPSFADDNVIVTATVHYDIAADTEPAAVAVGGVNKGGCLISVYRFDTGKALQKEETLKVKYIAIGKKPAS